VKRIRDRVGGLDVHRDSVTACARLVDDGEVIEELERFTTTRQGVTRLGSWLAARGVTTVAMEATGVYWKPIYYGLEGLFEELWVCNAAHVRNVPGRKTDLADAAWLADVVAHGMVRASFVPPLPIRALRELTRYRRTQVDARAQEVQRLEKVLQDACVKLTSVASTVWSVSARAMVEALIAGERDPAALADLAKGRMRTKTAELTEALASNWAEHHSVVATQIIARIDHLDAAIDELSIAIAARLDHFEAMIEQFSAVPGVKRTTAEIVIAENGGDVTVFPTPEQLCAWAGVAPANHESAGKHRPAGTRNGSRWLRRALIEAAKSASRTKDTYFAAQYRRIARRRGPNKAAVAVAHSILTVLWYLMADPDAHYRDLGEDYFDRRRDPAREADRLVRQLERLGYRATLEPAA
jgi:transposase